jgi:hypothetical protein
VQGHRSAGKEAQMIFGLLAACRLVESPSVHLDQRIASQHQPIGMQGRNRRCLRRGQSLRNFGGFGIVHLGFQRPLIHIRRYRVEFDCRSAQHRLARGAVRGEHDCFT